MAQNQHIRLVRALAFAENGTAPDWIMLVPAGTNTFARDGRLFANNNPDKVVEHFRNHFTANGVDMVVDYEHATEIEPTTGHPAAGWIDRVEDRDGAIWGHVSWTDKAAAMIESREYRFISPVMWHNPNTGEVQALESAALTHNPALSMRALAKREDQRAPQPDISNGDPTMNQAIRKALCAALDLNAEASDDAILQAATDKKTGMEKALASAQTPSLEKFVPRADHDAVKGDLEKAQARLADIDKQAVDGKVDAAIAAGKIQPSSRDYHLAACRADPAAFDAFIEQAPKLTVTEPSGLDGKKPDAGAAGELTAEDKAMCRDLGISEEDYIKTR